MSSVEAITISLSSAFCWAFFDVMRKKISGALSSSMILFIASTCQLAFFVLWILSYPDLAFTPRYAIFGPLAIVCGVVIKLLIIESLARVPISQFIPTLSLAPAAALLFSLLFGVRGELSSDQWCGLILLLAATPLLFGTGIGRSIGLGRSLTCGALAGLGIVLESLALAASSAQLHGLLLSLSYLLVACIRVRREGARPLFILPFQDRVLLSALATLTLPLHLLALEFTHPAALDGVQRSVGILVSLSLGQVMFHERVKGRQVAACCIICSGIVLVIGGN